MRQNKVESYELNLDVSAKTLIGPRKTSIEDRQLETGKQTCRPMLKQLFSLTYRAATPDPCQAVNRKINSG
jgi:hypothetical protein